MLINRSLFYVIVKTLIKDATIALIVNNSIARDGIQSITTAINCNFAIAISDWEIVDTLQLVIGNFSNYLLNCN